MTNEEGLSEEVKIPEGISISIDRGIIKVKGKGEVKRKLTDPRVTIKAEGKKVIVLSNGTTKREKKIVNTFAAHISNMIKGASEPYKYVLKICSGHFPMSVSVNKNELVIKNLLGEKFPRTLKIKEGADVKVEGDQIIVESCNKEIAGQMAADIELKTRRADYDRRIFQDGIYIISKCGEEVK